MSSPEVDDLRAGLARLQRLTNDLALARCHHDASEQEAAVCEKIHQELQAMKRALKPKSARSIDRAATG